MSRTAKRVHKLGAPPSCPHPSPPDSAFKTCDGHPHLLPGLAEPPPPIATFEAIPLNPLWASPGLAVAFIFHAECAASQEPEACPAF